MTKTERWLNLIAFLLDHRYAVTREEILSQVADYSADWNSGHSTRRESTRRKFERDKRELRELGVVLETQKVMPDHQTQEIEAYLLKPKDFYLPYLSIRSGKAPAPAERPYFLPAVAIEPAELPVLRRAAERVAQLVGTPLGAAAQSALRKLSFDIPETGVAEEERALYAPTPPAFDAHFAVLREAVERRRAVRARYYTIGRDAEEPRVIEPYGLMLSWGYWYCVGRARERAAMRVFRVDRMKSVSLVDGPAGDFAVPKDFTIAAYLNRAPWELSDEKPVTVRVRIAFPQSRWVIGEGLGRVTTAVTEDGGSELEFDVRSPDAFVRWLLPLGAQVQVLTPPGIKQLLDAERAQLRALYR
jgi:proteasome accessory factor B